MARSAKTRSSELARSRRVFALSLLALAFLPVSASGIPSDYAVARAENVKQGREIASLVASGDAKALYALFAPAFARQVSLATLRTTLSSILAQAPLGKRLGESVLPLSPSANSYIAGFRWGKRSLELQITLDEKDRIVGANLAPLAKLPPDPRARYHTGARLRLPFEGLWWVFWGGNTQRQNYHVIAPDQRHAFDFVAWQAGGPTAETASGTPTTGSGIAPC